MQNLIKKYGKSIVDQVIKNDELTTEEVKDIEYVEDRIITFLEWN